VWTEAVSRKLGKKKLPIQNYPDTSERGLSASYFEKTPTTAAVFVLSSAIKRWR